MSDEKNKKTKPKNEILKKENSYCLVCKKKTDNKNIKGVALENKIGQQKSICANFKSKKTFLKRVKNKK